MFTLTCYDGDAYVSASLKLIEGCGIGTAHKPRSSSLSDVRGVNIQPGRDTNKSISFFCNVDKLNTLWVTMEGIRMACAQVLSGSSCFTRKCLQRT